MSINTDRLTNPHQGQPIFTAGEPMDRAGAAMVMIHGRGASAHDILALANEWHQPGMAYLAPQAAGSTWYPNRFMEPIASNEPWLSSALDFVGRILAHIGEAGIPPERTMLLGFSQGACLTLEYAARHARRYGGVIGLSGGLIGPPGTSREYPGSFEGTPIFLGCSDVDNHIPKERVIESGEILERLGASVTVRLYPRMGHEVNLDEVKFVNEMIGFDGS